MTPQPEAPPTPPTTAPPMDMLAMIEERREKRRAAEAARRGPPSVEAPKEDAASRNLKTLTGREGVSGVFQILRKSTRTGEFAFNGWRPDARGQWREVYEVDAGLGGNVELAMVRRMIELIRTHYKGDFNWESYRLQRIVVLSARPEDTAGLEDFLMREFFGTPVLNPRPALQRRAAAADARGRARALRGTSPPAPWLRAGSRRSPRVRRRASRGCRRWEGAA